MIEIDRLIIDNLIYIFYSGIDFNILKDIEDHTAIVYIEKWSDVLKSVRRNNRISKVLYDESNIDESNIANIVNDNHRVCIYQTNGYLDVIHDTIKTKIKRNPSYLPIIKSDQFGIKNIEY